MHEGSSCPSEALVILRSVKTCTKHYPPCSRTWLPNCQRVVSPVFTRVLSLVFTFSEFFFISGSLSVPSSIVALTGRDMPPCILCSHA